MEESKRKSIVHKAVREQYKENRQRAVDYYFEIEGLGNQASSSMNIYEYYKGFQLASVPNNKYICDREVGNPLNVVIRMAVVCKDSGGRDYVELIDHMKNILSGLENEWFDNHCVCGLPNAEGECEHEAE